MNWETGGKFRAHKIAKSVQPNCSGDDVIVQFDTDVKISANEQKAINARMAASVNILLDWNTNA